jgi:hypothetical protein
MGWVNKDGKEVWETDYDDAVKYIKECPSTILLGLLTNIIQQSVRKKVFQGLRGLELFVKTVSHTEQKKIEDELTVKVHGWPSVEAKEAYLDEVMKGEKK